MITKQRCLCCMWVYVVAFSLVVECDWAFCTLSSQLWWQTLSTSMHSYFKRNLFASFFFRFHLNLLAHSNRCWFWTYPGQNWSPKALPVYYFRALSWPRAQENWPGVTPPPPAVGSSGHRNCFWTGKKSYIPRNKKMFFRSLMSVAQWSKSMWRLGKKVRWCHNNNQYVYNHHHQSICQMLLFVTPCRFVEAQLPKTKWFAAKVFFSWNKMTLDLSEMFRAASPIP